MRIAHLTDCFLPRLGGIELHVRDLARAQREAGHEVEILTSTPGLGAASGPRAPEVTAAGDARVRRFKVVGANVPSPAGLAAVGAAMRSGRYDVVHAHSSVVSPFAWAGLRAAVGAGVPAAATLHSMLSPGAPGVRFSAGMTGWSRWPVVWTAVSAAAAAPLRPVLGEVTVLPNGIDVDAWRVARPRGGDRVATVVTVMRLTWRKRPQAVPMILAGIRAQLPAGVPLRAVVVGDGPRRRMLERRIAAAGLDGWVELTGTLARPQVRRVLEGADVYLAPADRESFGIAALEARCAGLPVIGMAAGGLGEFVRDGVEGYLVSDDAQMAAVTARLLTSPALRRMQEHNRTTVPPLRWNDVVAGSLDVYHRARQLSGIRSAGQSTVAVR